ncbi:hypothetical protein ACLB2K_066832 [Fragaria x ananassa]
MLFFCLRLTQSRANPIPVHLFPKNPTITITITTPTSLFCSALLLSVFNLLYPLRGLTLSSETKQQQSSELFSIFKPNLCCSVSFELWQFWHIIIIIMWNLRARGLGNYSLDLN